jgi:hypothetical protein
MSSRAFAVLLLGASLVSPLRAASDLIADPLPNSCELIAAEASARMFRAGIWTRILIVSFEDDSAHALCVFQPRRRICVYDAVGSVDLDTESHDPDAIANLLAIRKNWAIKSARFLK